MSTDSRTHGILTERPPAQTYCGLATIGRNTSLDPFKVDCEKCKPIMELMGLLPSKSETLTTTKRGRPIKQKGNKFGLW